MRSLACNERCQKGGVGGDRLVPVNGFRAPSGQIRLSLNRLCFTSCRVGRSSCHGPPRKCEAHPCHCTKQSFPTRPDHRIPLDHWYRTGPARSVANRLLTWIEPVRTCRTPKPARVRREHSLSTTDDRHEVVVDLVVLLSFISAPSGWRRWRRGRPARLCALSPCGGPGTAQPTVGRWPERSPG